MTTPINQLDAEEITSQFRKLNGAVNKIEITFQTMKLKRLDLIASGRKAWLMKFQKKIPVIRALTTPGLKLEHIHRMSQRIKMGDTTDITKQTLETMLEAENHLQYLEQEADFANRQFTLYNNLKDMKEAWKPLMFDTIEWKGVSYILTGDAKEQIEEKLDDHIIKTQSMRGSPFIESFKEELFAWEDTLMATQENLEIWL